MIMLTINGRFYSSKSVEKKITNRSLLLRVYQTESTKKKAFNTCKMQKVYIIFTHHNYRDQSPVMYRLLMNYSSLTQRLVTDNGRKMITDDNT